MLTVATKNTSRMKILLTKIIKKIWDLDCKYGIFWWASLISFISVFFTDDEDIVCYWVVTISLITIASTLGLYRYLIEIEEVVNAIDEEIYKESKKNE